MNTLPKWSPAIAALLCLLAPGTVRAAETVDDSYTTPRTIPLSLAAPGILANDDCETCAVVTVEGISFEGQISFGPPLPGQDPRPTIPSGASLTVDSDGSINYDPSTLTDPNQPSDSFTYQAEDSRGLSAVGTVSITLTEPPANFAPMAADDFYSVELGSTLTVSAPGLLANDTDGDGDPLTVSLFNGAAPSFGSPVALNHGTLTLAQDGSFTYVPDAGATAGADEGFNYSASDGTEDSNSALVGISLEAPTTGDSQATVQFDDVRSVALDDEIGRSHIGQLEIAVGAGALAQVAAVGLPAQTAALILRSSSPTTAVDAQEVLRSCERMALVAQALPGKYDLLVQISTESPSTAFSVGADGEVIVELAETRVRCETLRTTGP